MCVVAPRQINRTYPSAESGEDAGVFSCMNWVTNHAPLEAKDELALDVLSHVLMGSSAAVLNKRLTGSHLQRPVLWPVSRAAYIWPCLALYLVLFALCLYSFEAVCDFVCT